jgi:hypothetical protein
VVPTGRATSASADTDIVVEPALVLMAARDVARSLQKDRSARRGRIFAGNLEKISSIQK